MKNEGRDPTAKEGYPPPKRHGPKHHVDVLRKQPKKPKPRKGVQ